MDENQSKSLLRAVIALLIEARTVEGKGHRSPEILLHDQGVSAPEIAQILGKNEGAVRKAIQRSKGK